MYIPSLFSTSANGCPAGTNAYRMANATTINLNTGNQGRVTVTANQYTNDVVGENYQGLGTYTTDIQLPVITNNTASLNLILPPTTTSPGINPAPFWGTFGQTYTVNYFITSSAGENLNYCYDCTQKWRYIIGSRLCSGTPPWPSGATPLKLAVLSSPSGSATNISDYVSATFNFCTGTTGSIEGYGPIWQDDRGGTLNSAGYYIIGRQAI